MFENLKRELTAEWPANRAVNIVCHGHSVPAGYFKTPEVRPFESYPHLFHRLLKAEFPNAVVNVIVTAIGGEDSPSGAARFVRDVLCHGPDLATIDYGLNDRRAGLDAARDAWRSMAEACAERGIPVVFMTPTWDDSYFSRDERWHELVAHAEQIRRLAAELNTPLCDSFAAWGKAVREGTPLKSLLSQSNHPNEAGHRIVAEELMRFFFRHSRDNRSNS